jgi:hypothetical protein
MSSAFHSLLGYNDNSGGLRENKILKAFCLGPKELEWSDEDQEAVDDGGDGDGEDRVKVEMQHVGHRRFEFVAGPEGTRYRWSGTRMHSGAVVRGLKLKGFAYGTKVRWFFITCTLCVRVC